MRDHNSRNRIELIGNVGKFIKYRTLDNGNLEVRFTLCTNERWVNGAGEVLEQEVWHNVVGFDSAARRIKDSGVVKGSKLFIDGRMTYNTRERVVDGMRTIYHNAVVDIEMSLNLSPRRGCDEVQQQVG